MTSFDKYLNRPLSPMPEDHQAILEAGKGITLSEVLTRDKINRLFDKGYHDTENGYHRLVDGSHYITVLTKMPKVSIEMLDWWFWWHAAEHVRYQIWYPGMHVANDADFRGRYKDESLSYRERLHLSTHLVTEDVGLGMDKIMIDFMHPKDFGFDETKLSPTKNTIICARVGSPDKGAWGTEMCHFVRLAEDGVEMRSRFWIGQKIYRMGGVAQSLLNGILNSTFVKKKLIPKDVGWCMFRHCSQEYHNLADILPEIYAEHGPNS